MWGSDYPHIEGTFVYQDGADMPSVTRLSLAQHVLWCRRRPRHSAWSDRTRSTCTTSTPPRCRTIAAAIGAPTLDELATPIDAVPAEASITAFRQGAGGWG